jgi:hypothetical protein
MSPASARRRRSAQEMTRVYAVMTCLVFVVVAQFVLLLVSVEGLQRGELGIVIPATIASGFCLGISGWLIRYILPATGRR